MNYLELVKRLGQEVSASGSLDTLANVAGEFRDLATWVNQAWIEIQEMEEEWLWMRKSIVFNLAQEKGEYTLAEIGISDHSNWYNDSFRIYETTIDNEILLSQLPYRIFRDTYLYGTTRTTNGFPSVVTVAPHKGLIFSLRPASNEFYCVADYQGAPVELTVDTDTPEMPSRYHMCIVYKAMLSYGMYQSAPEVFERARMQLTEMTFNLKLNQLPDLTMPKSFL